MHKISLLALFISLNITGNTLQNGKSCQSGTECASGYCSAESFTCTSEPTRLLVYRLSEYLKTNNISFDVYNILKQLETISPASTTSTGSSIGFFLGGHAGSTIGGALGGLVNPMAYLLKAGHVNLSPELKEFEKLLEDLINRIIVTLADKIKEEDIKAFTEKVFIFARTTHGKEKIINFLNSFNTLDSLREKTRKSILKNTTPPPTNLQQLVNEKTAHELENFTQEFKAFGKQISLG